jgi:hypothetical protein
MQIKNVRISFLQTECLGQPLRKAAPAIPFSFLLSGPLFQGEFSRALTGTGSCRSPWSKGYGKSFWLYYLGGTGKNTKELWRALVPLRYRFDPPIDAGWLIGTAVARIYLYPWGPGVALDIEVADKLDLFPAVDAVLEMRQSKKLEATLNGGPQEATVPALMGMLFDHVRNAAYGPGIAKGTQSEMFTVVTVLDGDGVDSTQAVADGSDLHRALHGLAGWNKLWQKLDLKKEPVADHTIPTRTAPAGHILYGTRRGRAVWFPDSFQSTGALNTLSCYHQNLTIASLQTESLCMLASDAAACFAAGEQRVDWRVDYDQCAQLAVGLLGRLKGGKGIYSSHSIQSQIEKTYRAEIDAVRKKYDMGPLT